MCRFVLREDADDVSLGELVWKSSCRKQNHKITLLSSYSLPSLLAFLV